MAKLIFDATLEGISTRVDKTIKVTLGTQEMDSKQAMALFEMRSKFIKVLFSDTAIEQKEVEAVNSLELKDTSNTKSKSQRLRSAYFVWWQQIGLKIPFDEFYNGQMESQIELIKSKIQ